MAKLGQRFDATEHDTTQKDYGENLPNGIYRLEMDTSEVVENGQNVGLKTSFVVIEPEAYKGRKLFNYYNLQHTNPDAERIGQEQFASLCRAVGVDAVDDSEELHFLPFVAKVALGKASEKNGKTYEARAEIKRYFFNTDNNGNAIDLPEPAIDAVQPTPAAKAPAANDNRPAPAQRQAAAAGGAPAKKNPWSKA